MDSKSRKNKNGVSVELLIPFHDCDPMQIVWHGHYIKYLEIARCELLDQFDYGYEKMRQSGYSWPVVEVRLKYVKPAQFGDKVLVHAHIIEWEHRIKVSYEIVNAQTGARLSKGYTVQVAVDLDTNEMCFESPPIALEKFKLLAQDSI